MIRRMIRRADGWLAARFGGVTLGEMIGPGEAYTPRAELARLRAAEAVAEIHRLGKCARFAVCDTGSAGERVMSIHRSLLGARLERKGRGRGVVRVVPDTAAVGWASRDFTEVEACVNVWLAGPPQRRASVNGKGWR